MSITINTQTPVDVATKATSDSKETHKQPIQDMHEVETHGDQVTLGKASKALGQTDDASVAFNEQKVDAIKKAITDGQYHVNSKQLAEKLLKLKA